MEGILLSQGQHSKDIVTDIESALLVYPTCRMPRLALESQKVFEMNLHRGLMLGDELQDGVKEGGRFGIVPYLYAHTRTWGRRLAPPTSRPAARAFWLEGSGAGECKTDASVKVKLYVVRVLYLCQEAASQSVSRQNLVKDDVERSFQCVPLVGITHDKALTVPDCGHFLSCIL
jgi:hypothetical protein